MKETVFNEKDSLRLISQMIQHSKKNMQVGSGNVLLYYGYSATILAVTVYLLVYATHNPIWSVLWFLMFAPYIFVIWAKKRSKPQVITHVDKAINSTWRVMGSLFILSVIGIGSIGFISGIYYFKLMLPLSLLYAGIGISITGVITNYKLMIYSPLVAFIGAIYMFVSLIADAPVANWWNLLFGVTFLIMMIIPGHILNRKGRESC